MIASALVAIGAVVPAQASTTRDSSGIRVVTTRSAGWSSSEQWIVGTAPSLTIRNRQVPGYDLYGVMGVNLRRNGAITVITYRDVRYFSSDGRYQKTVGKQGNGPGEWTALTSFTMFRGDSLLLIQGNSDRVVVFDETGKHVQTASTPDMSNWMVWGAFADGALLARHQEEMKRELGFRRPDERLAIFSRIGSRPAEAGRFLTNEYVGVRSPEGSIWMMDHLRARAWFTVSNTSFYYAPGDKYEVWRYDQAGRPDLVMRRAVDRPTATPRIVEEYRAAFLAEAHDEQNGQHRLRLLSAVEYPTHLPAYHRAQGRYRGERVGQGDARLARGPSRLGRVHRRWSVARNGHATRAPQSV